MNDARCPTTTTSGHHPPLADFHGEFIEAVFNLTNHHSWAVTRTRVTMMDAETHRVG